jgi:hypothetical protein
MLGSARWEAALPIGASLLADSVFLLHCHITLGIYHLFFNHERWMRSSLCSLVRRWPAALLLVALACAAPQRASAECGGYVTIHNSTSAATQHAMPPIGKDGAVPARWPAPCQGPNCSSAPARNQPLVPSAPVTQLVKEPATCPVQLGMAALSHRKLDHDTPFSRPVHNPSSVFHPPRLG